LCVIPDLNFGVLIKSKWSGMIAQHGMQQKMHAVVGSKQKNKNKNKK
jgi:hypothetical protein